MKTLNLIQGSTEWLEIRRKYLVASEAPIMIGASPHMSRDDLLKYKTTGDSKEVSHFQQIIFDNGHEAEAKARPIAEARLGEELYPVTGINEIDGLHLLASFDGLTMMEDRQWEHKTLNQSLKEQFKQKILDPMYFWQLEHQMLVSGNDYCIFAASNGDEESYTDIIYHSVPARRKLLIASWKQFQKDMENYVPIVVPPKAVAELVETLPALTYQTEHTSKGISLISNLDEYKAACVALVERSKQELKTDQDFANAESRVKLCKEAEEKIAHIQKQVLGEVTDIDKFSRDLEAIAGMLRQCRLNESKQVEQKKTQIRTEIINAAKAAHDAHIRILNTELAKASEGFVQIMLPPIAADYAKAISGKKTIKTLQEAANNELARMKVEADRVAALVSANLDLMRNTAKEFSFLFSDLRNLITMDAENLKTIAISRIADHKKKDDERIAAQAKKLADDKEAERLKAESAKAAPVIQQPAKQEPLFVGETFKNEPGEECVIAAVDEYFGAPVSSPVVDHNTGTQTLIGKDQIIEAVSKYWGVPAAQAALACISAFEPKL
ncbi:MAG: YqaJ viral recombinase family protein [Cellvibrio sp.]